jgi:hypothetical protein
LKQVEVLLRDGLVYPEDREALRYLVFLRNKILYGGEQPDAAELDAAERGERLLRRLRAAATRTNAS